MSIIVRDLRGKVNNLSKVVRHKKIITEYINKSLQYTLGSKFGQDTLCMPDKPTSKTEQKKENGNQKTNKNNRSLNEVRSIEKK